MDLHTKYRPTDLSKVLGHSAIVRSLKSTLAAGRSHAFLLIGPTGTGKTTLARCIAKEFGVDTKGAGYTEYDASVNSGVEDARAIVAMAQRKALTKTGKRVIVMDECHQLSKAAWNSLLKIVEEPPRGLVWIFCTTEGGKVPATVQSRCVRHNLQPMSSGDMIQLLTTVKEKEGMKVSNKVIEVVVEAAAGSPRIALVGLGMVSECTDPDEAKEMLATASLGEDSPEVIELCRAMLGKPSFQSLAKIVLSLQGKITAEGIRHVVLAYMSKCVVGSSWRQAAAALREFGNPYPAGIGDSLAPVLVSLAYFAEE